MIAGIVESIMLWSLLVAVIATAISTAVFVSVFRTESKKEREDSASWRSVGKFELNTRKHQL